MTGVKFINTAALTWYTPPFVDVNLPLFDTISNSDVLLNPGTKALKAIIVATPEVNDWFEPLK